MVALKRIKNISATSDPQGPELSMIRSPQDVTGWRQPQSDPMCTGLPHYILREVAALSDLRGHDNIIDLLDIFEIKGSKKIVLSFRLEKGGDLNQLLHRQRQFCKKSNDNLTMKGLPQ